MKFHWLLPLALALCACDSDPQVHQPAHQVSTGYWIATTGTVQQVGLTHDGRYSFVIIEADDHQMFSVILLDPAPPVWVGLRGQFAYESSSKETGVWKNFLVKKRLPDAEVKK